MPKREKPPHIEVVMTPRGLRPHTAYDAEKIVSVAQQLEYEITLAEAALAEHAKAAVSDVGALVERLRKRYAEPEIPPCIVCGRALRVQSAGGGRATVWGCDGLEADPDDEGRLRRIPGYDRSSNHYEKSRWTQYQSADSDVIALLDALISAQEEAAHERKIALQACEDCLGYRERATKAEEEAAELRVENERVKLHCSAWEDSARINKHRADEAENELTRHRHYNFDWRERALEAERRLADAVGSTSPSAR